MADNTDRLDVESIMSDLLDVKCHKPEPEPEVSQEVRNMKILLRLGEIRKQQCCSHIENQIRVRVNSDSPLRSPDARVIDSFLSNIKHLEMDSDATESTSSDDSCDELEGFSLQDIRPRREKSLMQRRMSSSEFHHYPSVAPNESDLKKKAIWKWAVERSKLASRWTWLQAQVADLEYRIRGNHDATIHSRAYKTPPLPQVLPENSCSRTVPISKDFRRRRLIKSSQILSDSNKRLVKLSNVPCVCSSLPQTVGPCLSCNGRYNYLIQLDGENAPISERVSLLDSCYHSVLSFPDDLTLGSQLAYLLKQETINRKPTKGRPGRKKGSTAANLAAAKANASAPTNGSDRTNKHAGKKGKFYSTNGLKNPSRTMITSNKLKRKYRKHSNNTNSYDNWLTTRRNKRIRSTSSMNDGSMSAENSNHCRLNSLSHNSSAQNVTRRRRSEQSAYDIDNIVIPFSMAATTRVEILEYKEIVTPSWRVWENGSTGTDIKQEEDIEDTSDEAYVLRHSKGESEEKKRFSLKPPKNTTTTTSNTTTGTITTSLTNSTTNNTNSNSGTAAAMAPTPPADLDSIEDEK